MKNPRMSPPRARRLLWLALILFLPVPYWAFGSGHVPVAWLLQLALMGIALLVTEGAMGPGGVIALLFCVETLLWLVVLRMVATRVVARVSRGAGEARARALVLAASFALMIAALTPIYATPLVNDGAAVRWTSLLP